MTPRFLAVLRPIALLAFVGSAASGWSAPVTDIGSRRELWLDATLIEGLKGKAELRLHQPQIQELSMVFDAPWEGNGCGYQNIFQDGDRYRLYYRAWQVDPLHEAHKHDPKYPDPHPPFWCYAESTDGIHWSRPQLGQHEFQGSTANNIIKIQAHGEDVEASTLAVFKDTNPNAAPDARYKAFLLAKNPRGMLACKSPDGIHWSTMSDDAVITDGAFDSQNLAFWDAPRGEYRAYWRYFTEGVTNGQEWNPKGLRAIRTATSKDFLHWEHSANLSYVDSPAEQLYTSQVTPYYRAPHMLLGFPTRYVERGWSAAMRALPDLENREMRAAPKERYGTALSEVLVMSSRDGTTFKRWNEAFIPPGIEHSGTWAYGDGYLAWQLVETKSALPGAPNELSFYSSENYWLGHADALRRYTLRVDGFVSAEAPLSGGELVTKPIRFQGDKLVLNFSTSAAGSVQVEIQDLDGKPLPGFALADCPPLFGDTLEREVTWTRGSDVTALAGKPVRLRFVLSDADVYSFRFSGR